MRNFGVTSNDQVHDVVRQLLALHLDELEDAGAIKGTDVAVDQGLIQVGIFAQDHVGPDDLFADIGHAHELDRDLADVLRRGRSLGLLRGSRPAQLVLGEEAAYPEGK